MNIFRKTLLGLLLGSTTLTAVAQEIRTSYFMQTAKFRHQLNPAFINRQGYFSLPFLGNYNIETVGNYGTQTFIFDIDPAQNEGHRYGTFMHPEVSNQRFFDALGNNDLQNAVNLNMNLISIGFKGFNGGNLIELNLHSNNNFNLPNQLFHFAKEGGANSRYNLANLGLQSQTYLEVALGHSHPIGDHFVVGAKAKMLLGLAYANLKVKQLDITMNDNITEVAGRVDGSFALLNSHLKLDNKGHIKDIEDIQPGLTGKGLAFDLGATYKVHGFEDLTLSAALTDIGYIQHDEAQNFKNKNDRKWTFTGFERAYVASDKKKSQNVGKEFEKMGKDLEQIFELQDTGKKGHGQGLATTLNIGAEYTLPVYRKLSFGVLHTQRFNDIYSWSSTMLSARVRPVKAVELGLSTAFTSTGTQVGGMVTFNIPGLHLFVAADAPLTKFSKQGLPLTSMNSNVAFGIGFPLTSSDK